MAVLTGTEMGDDREKAMELGAEFFRVKPFAFNDLVSITAQLRDQFLSATPISQAA
jgi:CheY-like chemotaxis protein